MSYLDDLKKKAQGVVNTVQNVGNAAYNGVKQVYNATQNAGQNIYNAATGNTQQKTQPQQTQAQKQQAQAQAATQPPAENNWVADYEAFENDRTMNGVGQGVTSQPTQSQDNTQNTAQSGLALTQNANWQSQLDDVMNKIMAGEKFNYDMNSDAMYQQYRDIYENQANMAMQNAMAQNAALTGGYGSSYGQMVGQQAYAQQMQGLNEIGLDLYDRAYNQYQNEQNDLYNQYNMLYGNIQDEIANGQWQKSFDEGVRQFDTTLDHQTTENQKDREFTTSEREATQEFTSGENDKNREHDIYMQDDSQEFTSSENQKGREHDIYMQDDQQEYQSGENAADREQAANEFAGMYGDYIYDENGNIVGTTGGHSLNIQNDSQAHDILLQGNEQSHDKIMQDDSQEHDVLLQGNEHTHDKTMQDDSQAHDVIMQDDDQSFQSGENDKKIDQENDQFGFLYGAEYDENGNLVTSENGGYYEKQANDEFEKMYGEEGYYTKKDKQDQDQFDKLYGTGEYDPETGEYIKGSGGFYTEQSMNERANEEEDWEKMYGNLQYDDEGNIIGGGYQTKKDATDNQIKADEFDKLYGEDGFYNKQTEDNQAHDKDMLSLENTYKNNPSSGETAATRASVTSIDSSLKRKGLDVSTAEGRDAIEGEIASLLRNDRISESEANYLIYYYGLEKYD